MALRKLTKMNFSEEQRAALSQETSSQVVVRGVPKSEDPVNYPVFEVPVNKKKLVYVPNHTYVDSDGVEQLLMDKPLLHPIIDGKAYRYYRCISSLSGHTGYSGDGCPLCEAVSEPWTLANYILENKCNAQGLNKEDTDNEIVKSIRSAAYGSRVIKEPNRYYTFPIVVFETKDDDGKTFLYDEEGNLLFKVMWYHISELQYEDVWVKSFEAIEDEPTHPGGHMFTLNYCYTPKRGEPNKRDSAKALKVIPKRTKDFEPIAKQLDELTKDWTPEKAREVVISNQFYTEEDLKYAADTLLTHTRDLIAIYESGKEGIADNNSGFALEERKVDSSDGDEEEGLPVMETDLD